MRYVSLYKKNKTLLMSNFKIKTLNISYTNLKKNFFFFYFYLPTSWKFIIINSLLNNNSLILFYLYSNLYKIWLPFVKNRTNFYYYDLQTNVITFKIIYINNFFKIYWSYFRNLFYSFNLIFFKKLKFQGKGYYIFKNSRNTILPQFGYSHKINLYFFFNKIKFLSKTSLLIFGINKFIVQSKSSEFKNIKSINIFTSKGIRFSKDIIYKKTGKISSYK